MTDREEQAIAFVLAQAAKAALVDAFAIWTIFDQPTDYPKGTIARMFLVAKDVRGPTTSALTLPLEELRRVFHGAGLTRITRDPKDESQIVESWI